MVIMSDTTVLNVKIDKTLKKQTQAAAKAIGLPVSTVVAASLREFVRTRSITLSDPPRIKPEIEAELLKIAEDAKQGIGVSPAFTDLEEARKWLDEHRDDD